LHKDYRETFRPFLQKKLSELRDKIGSSDSDYQGGNLSDADRGYQKDIQEYNETRKMLENFRTEPDYQ
jgi:hypothetical protein